jgi:hypothetical protein
MWKNEHVCKIQPQDGKPKQTLQTSSPFDVE